MKNSNLIFDINRTLRQDLDRCDYKSIMETCEEALDLFFKYAIAAIEGLQKEAERNEASQR